ncbi:RNA 2',3'-cyclic phosphodiesterase [Thermosyntropha sp.]|uniref:RNA 2',3'-cyclic phosphodiesterase n=1 Tax=Thermosyntropha sp. TaxID=2740820 RepID=UPI0025CFC323|nr:RNA 2',3'-cyclic phosphodiesterase [Thermosyntropha sp.]MBO8158539.1 RNA 2',3'-cyclic phosphodiesterase [Thermosyntropha sp.]
MRLFVAIPVPDEIKQYAYSIKEELKALKGDVKWVEYENYHITLKFLGEVDDFKVPKIRNCLSNAAESSEPFNLKLDSMGFFPDRHCPRVLWIGVNGELDKAHFLGERIDAYLNELDFESERKRNFHLTLGRIRSEVNQDKIIGKVYAMNQKLKNYEFRVESFALMESYLYPSGPVYKVNHNFVLKG